MAAPYNQLFQKLETAMAALCDALALAGVTTLTGTDSDTKVVPCVIVAAENGQGSIVLNTGIERLSATVTVVSSGKDATLAVHEARVGNYFDIFMDDAIGFNLSQLATDFHVYHVNVIGREKTREEMKWIDTLTIEVVCCGSTIT